MSPAPATVKGCGATSCGASCSCDACFAIRQQSYDPGRRDGAESGDEFRRPRAAKVAS